MEFRVLGPLEVVVDGLLLDIRGGKARALLAMLALHAGQPVATGTLVDFLWGDEAPRSATKALQTYVFRLRNISALRTVLMTRGSSYVLTVPPDAVDAHRFDFAVSAARRAQKDGDLGAASSLYDAALALWRGGEADPLTDSIAAHAVAARLNEGRLTAVEDRMDVELARGRHTDVIGVLKELTAAHPFRERLWGQLMLANYRSGNQAEALRNARSIRSALVEALGVEPSPMLRRLEAAVLEQDPVLALPTWIENVPAHPYSGCRSFFGRRQERGVLAAALQAARSGRGSFVLVTGEAGIGKTRLTEEVASEARVAGIQVAWGSVWEDRGAPPFWPWVQVVRALTDQTPPQAYASGGPSDLRSLLRPSEDSAAAPNTTGADASGARLALFDATTHLLRKAASETPLLVVLDDVHAADMPSLLLLEFLSSRLTDAAILLVATSRDVEARLVPGVAEVLGAAARHGSRLSLRGLAEDEVGDLMSAVAGVVPSVKAVSYLHHATEGNPFLVDELVRLLVSKGVPLTGDGAGLHEHPVPDGVREMVRSRTGRLSPDGGHTLGMAATIGRDFSLDVLHAASGRPRIELLVLVEEAVTLGLVRDVPQAPTSFRFAHSLTRQSVYEGLSASHRAEMHRRVGQALEALRSTRPSELAHHFRAAAPVVGPGPAIRYSIAAADEAMAGLAYEEAVLQYHHALDALGRDPEADPRQQCRVLLATSDAYQFAGDKAARGRLALEAARLASREGDAELLGESARRAPIGSSDGEPARSLIVRSLVLLPERSALRPQLLRQLAYIEGNSIFHEAAAGTVRAALEAARAVGDADVLIETLESLEHMVPYEPEGHRAITAEMMAVAPGANSPLGMLFAHRSRIRDLLHDGDVAGFDAERAKYEVIATRLRYGPSLVSVRRWALARLLLAGDFSRAERMLPELLTQAERAGDPLRMVSEFHLRLEQGRLDGLVDHLRDLAREYPQYPWRPRLAAALAEQGHHDEARDQFDDLVSDGFAAVRRDLAGFVLPLLADVCAELRDRPSAELLYRRLVPFDGRCVVVGSPMYACSGAVARHLGILACTLERWDAAEGHLHAALDRHCRMPSPPLVARTHHDLAALYRVRATVGDAALVRSHASECLRSAMQMGMRRLAEKASALIDPTRTPSSALY